MVTVGSLEAALASIAMGMAAKDLEVEILEFKQAGHNMKTRCGCSPTQPSASRTRRVVTSCRLRGALTDLVAAAPADRAGALERQLKLLDRDVTRELDDPLDRAKATRPADLS